MQTPHVVQSLLGDGLIIQSHRQPQSIRLIIIASFFPRLMSICIQAESIEIEAANNNWNSPSTYVYHGK